MDALPRRFVAIGDSFTEGLEDDLGPDGRHRGWADQVAAALGSATGGIQYANLAVRGRLLDEVVAGQMADALALRPDLVSFHAGVNDALRPRVDLAGLLSRYAGAVAALSGSGARVLTFTVVPRTGGSGRTADLLAARFDLFNATVRDAAARHGCLLVDLAAVPALQDRRLMHEDRLHQGPEGHARVAAAVLERLGVVDEHLLGGPPGWWRQPLSPWVPPRRRAAVLEDVRWVRRHFLPWAGRRIRGASSGDGVTAKHAELVDVVPQAARS